MTTSKSRSGITSISGMKCPICAVALVMTERQQIEVDYCPDCRGVWLDRGELDKIIERSLQPQSPGQQEGVRGRGDDAGYRRQGHGSGHRDRGHGRRSWLQDIFH